MIPAPDWLVKRPPLEAVGVVILILSSRPEVTAGVL